MHVKFIYAFISKNWPKSADTEQNEKFRNTQKWGSMSVCLHPVSYCLSLRAGDVTQMWWLLHDSVIIQWCNILPFNCLTWSGLLTIWPLGPVAYYSNGLQRLDCVTNMAVIYYSVLTFPQLLLKLCNVLRTWYLP